MDSSRDVLSLSVPSVKSVVSLIRIDLTSKDVSRSRRAGKIRLLFSVSLRFLLFNSLLLGMTYQFGCGFVALGHPR